MTSRAVMMTETSAPVGVVLDKINHLLDLGLYASVTQLFHAAGKKFLGHIHKNKRMKIIRRSLSAFWTDVKQNKRRAPAPDFLSRFVTYVFNKLNDPPIRETRKRIPRQTYRIR